MWTEGEIAAFSTEINMWQKSCNASQMFINSCALVISYFVVDFLSYDLVVSKY